jgi:hypothetical protein
MSRNKNHYKCKITIRFCQGKNKIFFRQPPVELTPRKSLNVPTVLLVGYTRIRPLRRDS